MHVLDVDLDTFLYERPQRPADKGRLSNEDFHPWPRAEVSAFLSTRCNLGTSKVPGTAVTFHHELFEVWRRLIASGKLEIPFHLTHVDSHADLGMGDASWNYIMCELLHRDVHERAPLESGGWYGLREGNFLTFAIACRWIASLTYVYHPDMPRENLGVHDIPDLLFRGNDPACGVLQLKKLPPGLNLPPKSVSPLGLEPEVPLHLVDVRQFTAANPYSFLFLAHSPGYTPPSADGLIETISGFMDTDSCC